MGSDKGIKGITLVIRWMKKGRPNEKMEKGAGKRYEHQWIEGHSTSGHQK